MALRKCPACKNVIAAETESCPICGCEPRARRLKQILAAAAVLGAMVVLFHGQLRQHVRGLGAPTSGQVQSDRNR